MSVRDQVPAVTEGDLFKTWALFAVCAAVGGFIAGAVVGGIIGLCLGMAQVPIDLVTKICGFAGLLAGLPVSYFCFRYFVARLIARRFPSTPDAIPPPLPQPGLES